MTSVSGSTGGAIYDELLRLLRAALREDRETLELAEKLLKVYRERGPRGVREEIRRLISEVLSSAPEA